MTTEEKAALLQWLDRMIKKAEQDERVAGRSPYALYWTGKASALTMCGWHSPAATTIFFYPTN